MAETYRSRQSQWITTLPPFEALAQPRRTQHLPRNRQALGWRACLLLRPSTCADDVTCMSVWRIILPKRRAILPKGRAIGGELVATVPVHEMFVRVEDAGRRGFGVVVVLQADAATNAGLWQPLCERRKLRSGSLARRRVAMLHQEASRSASSPTLVGSGHTPAVALTHWASK